MKIAARYLSTGMIIVDRDDDYEGGEIRDRVTDVVGPCVHGHTSYVSENGSGLFMNSDSEVEVEIPGFVRVSEDQHGARYVLVDMDSPVGVDAEDGEHGYIKIGEGNV